MAPGPRSTSRQDGTLKWLKSMNAWQPQSTRPCPWSRAKINLKQRKNKTKRKERKKGLEHLPNIRVELCIVKTLKVSLSKPSNQWRLGVARLLSRLEQFHI